MYFSVLLTCDKYGHYVLTLYDFGHDVVIYGHLFVFIGHLVVTKVVIIC